MAQTPETKHGSVDRQKAERVVHRFWIAYNNIRLYGDSHPLTATANQAFAQSVAAALEDIPALTIQIGGNAIECEDWLIDKSLCGRRLLDRLKDSGVSSLSFYRGITSSDLTELLRVLNDVVHFDTVEKMTSGLVEHSVKGFRFNYVEYKKVTKDQSVVGRNLRQFAELISHTGLENEPMPEGIPVAPFERAEGVPRILVHLRALRERVGTLVSDELPSNEEMVESLTMLRKSVVEELQTQAAEGIVGEAEQGLFTELDALGTDVILRIVREENQKGILSADHLAMLVRRLVPDIGELRRLLPRLRAVLLQEGMPLKEYLELVQRLGGELRDEGIMDILAEVGESIGVTVREILNELRKDPKTAITLILLSAELRAAGCLNDERYNAAVKQYVEKVMEAIAEQGERGGQEEAKQIQERIVSGLEQEFAAQLAARGAAPEVLKSVTGSLHWLTAGLGRAGSGGAEPGEGGRGGGDGKTSLSAPGGTPGEDLPEGMPHSKGNATAWLADELAKRQLADHQVRGLLDCAEELCSLLEEYPERVGPVLADYVNAIDKRISAVTDSAAQGEAAGEEAVEKVLIQLEEGFTSALKRHQIDPKAIPRIGAQMSRALAGKGTQTGGTGGDGLVEVASADEGPDEQEEDEEGEPDKAPDQTSKKSKFPPSVMKPKETRVQLGREVARAARYKCPLTCVSVSAKQLRSGDGPREPSVEEMPDVVGGMCERLVSLLRDADLVGSLGSLATNHLLVILPMTGESGASIVKARLDQALGDLQVTIGESQVSISTATSVVQFDSEKPGDAAAFLRAIKRIHKRSIEKVEKETAA